MKAERRERGFSLIEMVVVVAIIFIISAFAIFQGTGLMLSMKANAAQDTVFSQLRVARGLAISQRRTVRIWLKPMKYRVLSSRCLCRVQCSTCLRLACRILRWPSAMPPQST